MEIKPGTGWSRWALRVRRLYIGLSLTLIFLAAPVSSQQSAAQMPMQPKYEDGAEFRWLNKKVLDSRTLDSMEDLSSWTFAGAGEMTLTEVRAQDGHHSLRIRSTSNIAQVDGSGEWEDLI